MKYITEVLLVANLLICGYAYYKVYSVLNVVDMVTKQIIAVDNSTKDIKDKLKAAEKSSQEAKDGIKRVETTIDEIKRKLDKLPL